MNYLNKFIIKPWGAECCIFENNQYALWHLIIKPEQSTSLHSHPNKVTGLLVLDGIAELSFINQSHILTKLEKRIIRKGVFHSTKNLHYSNDLHLLEVEQPNNKKDILRLEDNYGRVCQPFQDDFQEKNPEFTLPDKNYDWVDFKKIKIEKQKISSIEELKDYECPLILTAGHIFEQYIDVLIPGDMTDTKTIRLLASKFYCKYPMEMLLFYAT